METASYMENSAGQIKDMTVLDYGAVNNINGSQRPLFMSFGVGGYGALVSRWIRHSLGTRPDRGEIAPIVALTEIVG